MTAGVDKPSAGAGQATAAGQARSYLAALRLVGLHMASRRVPVVLAVLVVCGAVLRAALYWHWIRGSGLAAQHMPLVIEAGAATVIAVTTASPFGEPERVTGRWLPYLRPITCVVLAGAAIGELGAGSAAEHLPGGDLELLRNVGGLVGIGLVSAAVLGGGPGRAGPMAYLAVAEYALSADWTTPWMWPTRPPHDRGAALCAALAFTTGIAVIAIRGASDSARE